MPGGFRTAALMETLRWLLGRCGVDDALLEPPAVGEEPPQPSPPQLAAVAVQAWEARCLMMSLIMFTLMSPGVNCVARGTDL